MLDGIPLANLAPETLLGACILLIILGRLVPWWFYKAKADECEKWRLAFESEREARNAAVNIAEESLRVQQDVHKIVVAVFRGAELTRQTGEAYVVPTATKE